MKQLKLYIKSGVIANLLLIEKKINEIVDYINQQKHNNKEG